MNFGDLIFQLFAFGAFTFPFILLIVLLRVIKKHHNQLSRMEHRLSY